MICGIGVFYQTQQSKFVSAFVSTTNETFTRHYSSVNLASTSEEISPSFMEHMEKSLEYVKILVFFNFTFPDLTFYF